MGAVESPHGRWLWAINPQSGDAYQVPTRDPPGGSAAQTQAAGAHAEKQSRDWAIETNAEWIKVNCP